MTAYSQLRSGDVLDGPEGHYVRLSRTRLGSRTYGRGGSLYGATARCKCGWHSQVNQAPSSGGTAEAGRRANEHFVQVRIDQLGTDST